jgi:hypothetical protein
MLFRRDGGRAEDSASEQYWRMRPAPQAGPSQQVGPALRPQSDVHSFTELRLVPVRSKVSSLF